MGENHHHAFINGFKTHKGSHNTMAKLTENDVVKIRQLSKKMKQIDIAKMFHICSNHISRIVNRKAWIHI
jgi:plasmid maintenance system antidote protein VapI